ncbi:MAG: 2-C-methyl-D-erythritol 2,4-cyclodiphosphate synthase [bacterium]|nr:MAG: 2-C-methyl-D-erythritol 2,4-cyclodiphosphate synthase [bacterium]
MLRVGTGFDAHALVEGRSLVLGGLLIPYEKGLLGHSDADVLTHAVCDALLGALAMGDIGIHFPPSDPRYKDASSIDLLGKVMEMLRKEGYGVGNIDSVIIAEAPKLLPYLERMRENLARTAGIATGFVSIKATTTEGMGFTGRREGIAAHAVATVIKIPGS